MGIRSHALALLLASCGAAACSREEPPSLPSESSDSAGWRIVENRFPAWTGGQGWRVLPDPRLSIGVMDGPEEYQLVQVGDAALRSDGSVVVVDRGARIVRLYGPRGAFRARLGGPGGGPGEFTDPVAVLVTEGDTMVVWDQALLRTTRFAPSGELASVRTVDWGRLAVRLGVQAVSKGEDAEGKGPGLAPGLVPGPMEPLGDGGFLVRLVDKGGPPAGSGSYRPRGGAVWVSEDLAAIDTLALFGDTEQVVVEAPWGPFAVAPPGARETRLTHGENTARVCVGDQQTSEVVCFGQDGERLRVRWEADPLPFGGEEVHAWRDATLHLLEAKLARDQILDVLDQVSAPRLRPPYSGILLDASGNLWVERGPADEGSRPATDFFVFDPEGTLLGEVALPPIRVLEIGVDYVLGVHEDELGIQSVQVYPLRKPSGEGR